MCGMPKNLCLLSDVFSSLFGDRVRMAQSPVSKASSLQQKLRHVSEEINRSMIEAVRRQEFGLLEAFARSALERLNAIFPITLDNLPF